MTRSSLSPDRWAWPLVALLLVIFATSAVASLRQKSGTFDEGAHQGYGARALEVGSFERISKRWDSTMPVSVLNALPTFWAQRNGIEVGHWQNLFWGRLPTVALGVLLGFLVAAWSRELYGPSASVVAAVLYCFSPNILAHTRLMTTDLATALGVFGACYAFWRYRRSPTWGRMAVAGAAFGLAQLTKITAAFLLPVFLLILLFEAASESRRAAAQGTLGAPLATVLATWLRRSRVLIVFALFALVFLNLGFIGEDTMRPFGDYSFVSQRLQKLQSVELLAGVPVPVPAPVVQGVDMVSRDLERDRWIYCLGDYAPRGLWYYFLVALALKVPIGGLALFALSALLVGRFAPESKRDTVFLLLPAGFFLIYLSFFYHYQIGLRHLLPAFPLAQVFASRAALVGERWFRIVGAGALAAYVLASVMIYPHYLAYFNSFAGGPLNGWRYLADSNLDWGQDKAAARRGYVERSEVPVVIRPDGPTAGRILVDVNSLVGLKPQQADHYRWLRENFEPIDHVGYSWHVYDVDRERLQECCSDELRRYERRKGEGRAGRRRRAAQRAAEDPGSSVESELAESEKEGIEE